MYFTSSVSIPHVKENDPKVKAAVLMSAKEGDFVAGADINMFTACKVLLAEILMPILIVSVKRGYGEDFIFSTSDV